MLSEEGARELRELIGQLTFVFAKTMPDRPHEYVVKTPDNLAAYTKLFEAIKEHGLRERSGGRHYYRYLYLDHWRYWAMTT
jgi:hypothetical protein